MFCEFPSLFISGLLLASVKMCALFRRQKWRCRHFYALRADKRQGLVEVVTVVPADRGGVGGQRGMRLFELPRPSLLNPELGYGAVLWWRGTADPAATHIVKDGANKRQEQDSGLSSFSLVCPHRCQFAQVSLWISVYLCCLSLQVHLSFLTVDPADFRHKTRCRSMSLV